ncbi:MAG: sigma-70 family RNA polymerase sigma factor [Cyclobacteriaceae bacterium]
MRFRKIVDSIKSGDNVGLKHIYVEYGPYCVKKLISSRNCSTHDAEDLFIDAVIILRNNILQEKITDLGSVRAYLFKTCENIFLAKLKKEKSEENKHSEIKEIYYSNESENGDISWNNEIVNATKEAWSQLREKCQDILSYFYVDNLRMKEIAELMNFTNSDVAKTTKARCYKKFMQTAHEIYQSTKKSYVE